MEFFNRGDELKRLKEIEALSKDSAQMSVIVGRRRIGKTTLLKKAYSGAIYFFVSKKSETLLCEEFLDIVKKRLDIKIIGEVKRFSQLFEYILDYSTRHHFTLIIDEFQEFGHINSSIYSDMQNLWDSYKDKSHLNLVLSGSIYSMMKKIFESSKEPLFGRANHKIELKPFTTATLKEIFKSYYPNYTNDDLLRFYMLTGGVAKYVEIFVDNRAFDVAKQLNLIFGEYSLFIDEGKNLLIEEFGKEYTTYFSILSLIASSKTSRAEIESILEKNIGGYLDRLENEYRVIKKIKPIFAKEGSRSVKYQIVDNFFNFWFRFIYKYKSAVELENYDYLKEIFIRDYETFSGYFLEKYFQEKLKLSKEFSQIGNYWERGNQNEIDIVAINELKKRALIAEVKRNPKKIELNKLKQKSIKLLQKLKGYKIEYRGYSLEDM